MATFILRDYDSLKMRKIECVAVIVSARLASTRIPLKMIRPFAGNTLFDIILDKLIHSSLIPRENIYASVYEPELKVIARRYGVNIFPRSAESANSATDPSVIYEWWNRLPARFTHFILINPCLPLLSLDTIEAFTQRFLQSPNPLFGVVEKRNFIFMDGVMINHFKHFPPPDNKIMNTLVIPPWHEAAHCLYGGRLKDIPTPSYLGSFDQKDSPELFTIPEREYFDIDHEWQFRYAEILYRGLIK